MGVLKGVTFQMCAGERIGVVGRTGAGKSSLLVALFRIAEPEPDSLISLDGQNVLELGLKDLRRALAMIPQDSVLFQGTLRYNCDPFVENDDATIWAALEEAQLASWVRQQHGDSASESSESLLKMDIQEGGQNLSAGQRQMVAIARAVLRKSKFVVLDEATAAVDAATDAAIKRCFKEASSLTIAHRIDTILDSDRILVMDAGQIAELGTPEDLRKREDGIFKSLVYQWEKSKSG